MARYGLRGPLLRVRHFGGVPGVRRVERRGDRLHFLFRRNAHDVERQQHQRRVGVRIERSVVGDQRQLGILGRFLGELVERVEYIQRIELLQRIDLVEWVDLEQLQFVERLQFFERFELVVGLELVGRRRGVLLAGRRLWVERRRRLLLVHARQPRAHHERQPRDRVRLQRGRQ
jgi:hypothetical protein